MTTAEIKHIRALAQKKYRDANGLFVVEGEKMVSEALTSGFVVEKIYRMEEIGRDSMLRISQLSSPSPVLAVVRQKPVGGDIKPGKGLYLALDSIRDPGNLGTIIRIADWFGLSGIIASPDTVELYNPKVVQSTMGAVFRVDFHYTDLEKFLSGVRASGGRVYGTFLKGDNIYEAGLYDGADSPSIIIIGNEANGISDRIAALVTDSLTIPPFSGDSPTSESLNAAVATAITVSEFRRRKFTNIIRK